MQGLDKCQYDLVEGPGSGETRADKYPGQAGNGIQYQWVSPLLSPLNTPIFRWKMAAWKKTGMSQMNVELEVVMVENLGLIGIRRKRLAGDAFLYKKVCEQILLMAGL